MEIMKLEVIFRVAKWTVSLKKKISGYTLMHFFSEKYVNHVFALFKKKKN